MVESGKRGCVCWRTNVVFRDSVGFIGHAMCMFQWLVVVVGLRRAPRIPNKIAITISAQFNWLRSDSHSLLPMPIVVAANYILDPHPKPNLHLQSPSPHRHTIRVSSRFLPTLCHPLSFALSLTPVWSPAAVAPAAAPTRTAGARRPPSTP